MDLGEKAVLASVVPVEVVVAVAISRSPRYRNTSVRWVLRTSNTNEGILLANRGGAHNRRYDNYVVYSFFSRWFAVSSLCCLHPKTAVVLLSDNYTFVYMKAI